MNLNFNQEQMTEANRIQTEMGYSVTDFTYKTHCTVESNMLLDVLSFTQNISRKQYSRVHSFHANFSPNF